jgi:acyl dehydratase
MLRSGVNTAKLARPEWADVEVGQRLDGVEVTVDWTTVALQVSGSQDWNRIHHDPDFALESGHPSIFLNTGWTSAIVFRVASDWIGVSGWIERFELRMRQMNAFADKVRSGGQVRNKRIDSGGRRVVDLDLWLENDRVGRTTIASAVVVFPTPAGGVE